jgi:DNA-binding response OmpR family regulator
MIDHWILVAEGDHGLRENVLIPGLQYHGFDKVVGADSALEAYRAMATRRYAVVVMDIGLPDESGLSLARHVRTATSARVVVLADRCGGRLHHALGMDGDIDGYLAKPVDLELMAASLRSIFRHHFPARAPSLPHRDWQLDLHAWVLISPAGARIPLTLGERALLRPLFEARAQVVPRAVLIAGLLEATGQGAVVTEFDPHRLELLVHRLRQKIGRKASEPFPLRAARGAGYVLTR